MDHRQFIFTLSKYKVMHDSHKRSPLSPTNSTVLSGTFKFLVLSSNIISASWFHLTCYGQTTFTIFAVKLGKFLVSCTIDMMMKHSPLALCVASPSTHWICSPCVGSTLAKGTHRMWNKYWNAGYDELLEMSCLPSLSDRRFYLNLCSLFLSCATSGRFFFLSGRPSCIFSTDLTCSLNHSPILTGYKCICMTSSAMPGTLGYVNASCMALYCKQKIYDSEFCMLYCMH